MLLASCPLLLAVLHEWEFSAYAAYLFRAGAPDNSSVAGSAVQIAPTVNKPPGTRDLPTILWPWLRMILPAAQPTNCLAASNSRRFVRRSVSSSGYCQEAFPRESPKFAVPLWGSDDFSQPPPEASPAVRLEPRGHCSSPPHTKSLGRRLLCRNGVQLSHPHLGALSEMDTTRAVDRLVGSRQDRRLAQASFLGPLVHRGAPVTAVWDPFDL
jgi:hypothetical protein